MARRAKRVAIVGGGLGAAQCGLTLAQLGAEVTIVTPLAELSSDSAIVSEADAKDQLRLRPLLLQAASHPRVSLYTLSEVDSIAGSEGEFTIKATRQPRYVRPDICTSCGRCEAACSVKVPLLCNGERVSHTAIHPPLFGSNAVPSAYSIAKRGIAPCTAACPLGINVQGYVSLLAKGKVDKALSLMNEAAPLAGVLGRVCTHPCEDHCKRRDVDAPVFIKALHRYAADNASSGIRYTQKAPAGSRKEKIGIVGSGPAGLACAWELARLGYSPVIFESHAVVGGMLATGIPRFRMPREVREREVKAIEAMGVEIRTGMTIGRDVTIPDLRERGYRAFFLAVGAHQNIKLNIPGENLEGVVDSVSLLFELNLRVGASVGRNMVVIGGGNSAVDSARTARRKGRRNVTILYRRTAEEMTAIKEDIEEALNEGISIQYLTAPVEILGDGTRVTGIRCQRMELGEAGADGRREPVPIAGSEFVMEADHVVLAIGQRPNTAQLNARGVMLNRRDATVKVDPLTLQTSISDVFAGGDCVTGPNSVVEAMADGLRAAESIDRYLRGRSLTKGRTLERPEPVDVNIDERYMSADRRAHMPLIPRAKRMGTFEETSTGLPPKAVDQETARCLNCALCSSCMECERACDLGAVFHNDEAESIQTEADMVVRFTTQEEASRRPIRGRTKHAVFSLEKPGMYSVQSEGQTWSKLAQASSVALEVASQLNLRTHIEIAQAAVTDLPAFQPGGPRTELTFAPGPEARIGVVLCRCGSSIASVIDFARVSREVLRVPGVSCLWDISQACTEEGAADIATHVIETQVSRVVIAACRCCNLDQICFSCTDRRVMCQQRLHKSLAISPTTTVEFVNIREQCAWVHRDDPENATRKAIEMISAAIAREGAPPPALCEGRPVEERVLLLGAGLAALAAANNLAAHGYPVTIVSGPATSKRERNTRNQTYLETRHDLLNQLKRQGVEIDPWPQALDFSGSPGHYEAVLRYGEETSHVNVGAVIVHIEGKTAAKCSAMFGETLLGRIFKNDIRRHKAEAVDGRPTMTTGENAGIFILRTKEHESPEEQVLRGEDLSVRTWAHLAQGMLSPRTTAVTINFKLCRGCGECAALCPYIEMKNTSKNTVCAHIDPLLCLGCGACMGSCPTGAISQPLQGDEEITSALEAMLRGIRAAEVR